MTSLQIPQITVSNQIKSLIRHWKAELEGPREPRTPSLFLKTAPVTLTRGPMAGLGKRWNTVVVKVSTAGNAAGSDTLELVTGASGAGEEYHACPGLTRSPEPPGLGYN